MLGGMLAVFFSQGGMPLPVALVLAILVPALVGIVVEKLAIEPVKGAGMCGLEPHRDFKLSPTQLLKRRTGRSAKVWMVLDDHGLPEPHSQRGGEYTRHRV